MSHTLQWEFAVLVFLCFGCDDCYSPYQNVRRAYEEGAVGCACNAKVDKDVCVSGAALICENDNRWHAVEDGPCYPQFVNDSGPVEPDASPEVADCKDCSFTNKIPSIGDDCGTNPSEGRSPQVANCVQEHLQNGKPFHVRVDLRGIDSVVAVAWTQDGNGTVKRYLYDSDICGGNGCATIGCGPRVDAWVCDDPEIIPDVDVDAGIDDRPGYEIIRCFKLRDAETLCEPKATRS